MTEADQIASLTDRVGLLEQQVALFSAITAQLLSGRWTGADTDGHLPHPAARPLSWWRSLAGRRPRKVSASSQSLFERAGGSGRSPARPGRKRFRPLQPSHARHHPVARLDLFVLLRGVDPPQPRRRREPGLG